MAIPRKEDNVLIQDVSNDFDVLIDKADKLIEKTESDRKWNEIQYETIYANKKSYAFSTFLALLIVALIITIVWYFYKTFFKVDT